MAIEKTFNTRIQLKYDTWDNWTSTAGKTLVLKQGELATVYVPGNTNSGQTTNEPAFLMKVGDGTTKFESLPWVYAKAADVYEWAKAATKPTYTANEISGLDDYISGKVQDTNTTYRIDQDSTDGHILILQKKELGEDTWTTVDTITIPDNDTKYTLETGTTNGTIKLNDVEVKVAGLQDAAYTTVESLNTTAKNYADAVESKLTTLTGELASISKTGSVNDLVQPSDTIIVFDCGTSSTVI